MVETLHAHRSRERWQLGKAKVGFDLPTLLLLDGRGGPTGHASQTWPMATVAWGSSKGEEIQAICSCLLEIVPCRH